MRLFGGTGIVRHHHNGLLEFLIQAIHEGHDLSRRLAVEVARWFTDYGTTWKARGLGFSFSEVLSLSVDQSETRCTPRIYYSPGLSVMFMVQLIMVRSGLT